MDALIEILNNPRVAQPRAVHDYDCKDWREGRRHGPCTCGARELDARLRAALIDSGVRISETPNEITERLEALHE